MQMRKLHIGKREGREREREGRHIPMCFLCPLRRCFQICFSFADDSNHKTMQPLCLLIKATFFARCLNETAGPWTISPAQKLVDEKAIIDMNIPALYSNWNLIPEASFTVLFRWMGKSWLWKLPRHEVEACFCAALLWNGVSDTKAVRSLLCL